MQHHISMNASNRQIIVVQLSLMSYAGVMPEVFFHSKFSK